MAKIRCHVLYFRNSTASLFGDRFRTEQMATMDTLMVGDELIDFTVKLQSNVYKSRSVVSYSATDGTGFINIVFTGTLFYKTRN